MWAGHLPRTLKANDGCTIKLVSTNSERVASFIRAVARARMSYAPCKRRMRAKMSRSTLAPAGHGNYGAQQFVAGKDFGDFVVWRHDDIPAYQLAVVIDDAAMEITEVVRGEDLLISTARQFLLYRALDLQPPRFYHCPVVKDETGVRLAKRHEALSLRALRSKGFRPDC